MRAPHRGLAVARGLLAAASTLALLVGGLLLIRWVGSANAAVSYTGQARVPVVAAPASGAPAPAAPNAAAPAAPAPPPPSPDADLIAASQEGMRLGIMALADDDLQSARDFFVLAVEAYPRNTAAGDRLRQVETALQIDERTSDLTQAVDDLAELRRLAPGSPGVLQAYVTALIRAGREALATGEGAQAAAFCAEAVRWLPARPDAQSCMPGVGPGVAATAPVPTVARTVTPLPAPTGAPVPSPTVVVPTPAPAIPAPTSMSSSEPSGTGASLHVVVSGGCQPAAAGARSIQVDGTVSANGAAATGASVQVRIADAAGRVIDTSSFPIASQRFALQRTIAGGGPHTVTVTAVRDDYDPGEATLRVSC